MKDKNKTKLIIETWRGFLNESSATIDYAACNKAAKSRLSQAYLIDLGVNNSSWRCAIDYIDNIAGHTDLGKLRVERALNVLASYAGVSLDEIIVCSDDNLMNAIDPDDQNDVSVVFDDLQNPDGSGSGPSGLGPIHRSGWKIGVYDYQMEQVRGASHEFMGTDPGGYNWRTILYTIILPKSNTSSAPQDNPLDFEGSVWQ